MYFSVVFGVANPPILRTFVPRFYALTSMNYRNIICEKEAGILTITINRPANLNALNKETIDELSRALDTASQDEAIRVLIITGSGEKAFVAGADIKEFAHYSPEEGRELASRGQMLLFNKVENMEKPVIAAVNGFALGGGLELAMSAHIRIASENAKMGLPEVSLGVIPGYGGTQRLARLIGRGKATEITLTAAMIPAAEALQWGLVNAVYPPSELLTAARSLAEAILRNSPVAVAAALRSIKAGFDGQNQGFIREIEEFGNCFNSGDFREGTTAFIEKRKPIFPGK